MSNLVFKWKLLSVLLGFLTLTVYCGTANDVTAETPIVIPAPAFEVETLRSDLQRPVRSSERSYDGPLFDTHAHLYPPHGRKKAKAVFKITVRSYGDVKSKKCAQNFANLPPGDDEH